MELLKGLSARGRRLSLGVLVAAFALLGSACGGDAGPQDFLTPEGPVAERADGLWDITFAIAVVIFFIVELLLVYAIIRFRARPGQEAKQFHGNTKVEVVLTLIPTLILAGLGLIAQDADDVEILDLDGLRLAAEDDGFHAFLADDSLEVSVLVEIDVASE